MARPLRALRWTIRAPLGWDDEDSGVGSRGPTLRERMRQSLGDAPSGLHPSRLFRRTYVAAIPLVRDLITHPVKIVSIRRRGRALTHHPQHTPASPVPDRTPTRTPTRVRGRGVARAAGWIAVAFGVVHIVVAPLDHRHVWAEILGQGPWNTLSLDVTPENLAYSEAFWVGPASFGVPVLLLGALVVWSTRRGERLPAAFGWAMIAWGGVLVALLPASPAWTILLVGVLIVLAARAPGQDRSATTRTAPQPAQRS